ncbi:hypothetical protein FA15DRAFT_706660 [Coprinopsis marcescibilis]|uniref:Nicotinamide N-methyltransferase n=1 Tax=Coprinopsis marcescibilis TaxID=230819 RepID=A0A5C3KPW9_COPMA|nr:hypothetical protein FA15DRAFT_706660 [Coprinopsis marcescibilis]
MGNDDYEDILNDSLEFLGGKPVVDGGKIHYGPLELTTAPKDGKANTLMADHLFSPSIFLSERIERGLLSARHKSVLELGAGAALPSLLLSTLQDAPSLVVVTDYPDEGIMGNIQQNILRNKEAMNPTCKVLYQGYNWGQDSQPLLELNSFTGYDVLILSDLVHFDSCHEVLVSSITALLRPSPDARVHVSAGFYTKPEACTNFIAIATAAGLKLEEIHTDPTEGWKGTMEVTTLNRDELAARKAACRYWVGAWSPPQLQ